ncbi:MAG TPA: hypothetical protein VKS21_05770, partial [Spirochaetota bacterium]|nr:hypothetical protein [Spirochaetota bacterium]
MKKTFYILIFFNMLLRADWWVEEHDVEEVELGTRIFKQNIVCSLYLPEHITGKLFLFYSLNKPLRAASDLTHARLFMTTNALSGYYKLKPVKNGNYYTAALILQAQNGRRQLYLFTSSSNKVTVNHLAAATNTNQSNRNKPEGTVLLNKKAAGKKVELTNTVSDEDLEMLENFINEIRAFRLELREEYFSRRYYDNTDIYSFLVRYTAITGKLDNIYLMFITKQYNWEYIPKINREYNKLSKAVLAVYKKITSSLKKEL